MTSVTSDIQDTSPSAATGSSVHQRERRLQRRRERERALRQSETAEQREQQLRRYERETASVLLRMWSKDTSICSEDVFVRRLNHHSIGKQGYSG